MSKRKRKPAIVCDDVPLWGVEAKRLMDEVGLSLDNARSSVIRKEGRDALQEITPPLIARDRRRHL